MRSFLQLVAIPNFHQPKESSMSLICPKCGSNHTASYQSVHRSGTTNIQLEGTLRGGGVYATLEGSGQQRSQLAADCAPPYFKNPKKDLGGYALIGGFLGVLAAGMAPPSNVPGLNASTLLVAWVFVGPLVATLAYKIWKWNIQLRGLIRTVVGALITALILRMFVSFEAAVFFATMLWGVITVGNIGITVYNLGAAEAYAKWETAWKCLSCNYGFYSS